MEDTDRTEPTGGGRMTGREVMDFLKPLVEKDDVTHVLAFLGRMYALAEADCEPPPQPVFGPRHHRWDDVRNRHIKEFPTCTACGQGTHVEVHHVEPYHLRPELELVAANLVTLCDRPGRSCHFSLGHLWDWNRANPFVREVAATLYGQLQEATKGDK
jgi:5-methylcytosine-specific restriction protein A